MIWHLQSLRGIRNQLTIFGACETCPAPGVKVLPSFAVNTEELLQQ